MTKRKTILCGLMAAAMLMGAGCSLISVDKEKDLQQVVAKVNGASILKSDLVNAYEDMAYEYAAYYGIDIAQMGDMQSMLDSIMEQLIAQEIIKQKAAEKGLNALTDEENKEIDDSIQEIYDYYNPMFEQEAKDALGEGASEETVTLKRQELVDAYLSEGGYTMESIRADYVTEKVEEKLRLDSVAHVTVDEAEIQSWYDTQLEEQKTTFAETPSSYESAVAVGDPILFVPEGYVRAKRIQLLGPENEDIQDQMQDKLDEQQTIASEITALIVDDKTKNAEEIEALEVKLNASKEAYKTLRDSWLAPIRAKAEEVLAKVKAGGDFDALIAEYGQDEGMLISPEKEEGYLLGKGAGLEQEVIDAALALQNAGDTSPLVASSQGYNIIKLIQRLQSRTVPLGEVRGAVAEKAKEEKQNTEWESIQGAWRTEASVEKFPDRYKDVGAAE